MKPFKPFELGEKIIFYDVTRKIGRIVSIHPRNIRINCEDEFGKYLVYVHLKQCRHIKQKTKSETTNNIVGFAAEEIRAGDLCEWCPSTGELRRHRK
jgi:hypothetical protein